MKINGPDLAEWTKGHWVNGIPKCVENITFDSRLVSEASIFIAMTHGQGDGHEFIGQARDLGALGCIVERASDIKIPQLVVPDTLEALVDIGRALRELFEGCVIGLSGSCGKTSTKSLIEKAIGERRAYARKGNWNNKMGVPLTFVELHGKRYDFAMIEAGISEPGEMSVLSSVIKPDLCVITNIGQAHLDGLGSLESVADEKAKLLEYATDQCRLIAPKSVFSFEAFKPYEATAISVEMISAMPSAIMPLEIMPNSYYYHSKLLAEGRSEVTVLFDHKETTFSIATTSPGMVENSILAFATAVESGIEPSAAASGIADWMPDNGRGSIEHIKDALFYNDTYNANPTSMRDSLKAFTSVSRSYSKKMYILGVMGELGATAAKLHFALGSSLKYNEGDRLILIGETKLVGAYQEGALSANWPTSAIEIHDIVDSFKSNLANFSGAVFLKGSRTTKLESLIPSSS
jgi:UDP-N-acetylmuramoyl-tripeptide--D-alanyl-D-alanine ligase